MKERPIIFSIEMVKAILDGRKTQTRRVVKPQKYGMASQLALKCPYGKIGDRLWVREAWKIWGWNDGEPFSIQYKDGTVKDDVLFSEEKGEDYWIQCADDCIKAGLKTNDEDIFVITGDVPTRWRPSIFMPREASRITLEIINIRVERLQEINKDDYKDFIAEGLQFINNGNCEDCYQWSVSGDKTKDDVWFDYPDDCFQELWDSINSKKGFGWDTNPWVWVIEFKLVDKPLKA